MRVYSRLNISRVLVFALVYYILVWLGFEYLSSIPESTEVSSQFDFIQILVLGGYPLIIVGVFAYGQLKKAKVTQPAVIKKSVEETSSAPSEKLMKATKSSNNTTTLAVLPFTNNSPKGDYGYFVDGIAEDLIHRLSRVEGLTVISRISHKGFRKILDIHEIAQRVSVNKVVNGSVRREEGNLQMVISLEDSASGVKIWEETYDGKVGEIRSFVNSIPGKIIQSLKISSSLKSEDQTSIMNCTFEAYDLFLKGRYLFNQRENGLKAGIEKLEMAILKDPKFAPAYACLSQCYNLLGFYEYDHPKNVFPQAKEAAMKSIEIDPTSVEGHTSLAFALTLYDWNWEEAEVEFKKAISLNPGYATAHHWYAEFLFGMGRLEEGIGQSRQAQKYDPLGLIVNTLIGMAYYYSREYDKSIAECEKTLNMSPDYLPVFIWLGVSYIQKGMVSEAVDLYERGRTISKGESIKMTSLLTYAYGKAGQIEKSSQMEKELEVIGKHKYISAFEKARIALGVGNPEEALNCLEVAIEERASWLIWLKEDPMFDELRGEQRFHKLVAKLNMT